MTWIFPGAAAAVAGVFTVMLTQRWVRSRSPYLGCWAIAMGMYAAASLSLTIGAAATWSPILFRTYWLFGAILTVPFLAAGEGLLLMRSDRARRLILGVVTALSVTAAVVVFTEPLIGLALGADLPRGAAAFAATPLPLALARAYAYISFVLLIAGAGYSAWGMRGRPDLRNRFFGTLLIALGATVVAGGSAFAATGVLAGFSLALLGGICLMFAGFLVASRAPAAAGIPAS